MKKLQEIKEECATIFCKVRPMVKWLHEDNEKIEDYMRKELTDLRFGHLGHKSTWLKYKENLTARHQESKKQAAEIATNWLLDSETVYVDVDPEYGEELKTKGVEFNIYTTDEIDTSMDYKLFDFSSDTPFQDTLKALVIWARKLCYRLVVQYIFTLLTGFVDRAFVLTDALLLKGSNKWSTKLNSKLKEAVLKYLHRLENSLIEFDNLTELYKFLIQSNYSCAISLVNFFTVQPVDKYISKGETNWLIRTSLNVNIVLASALQKFFNFLAP